VDKCVFVIEMPEFTDEQCVAVQDFLWDVIRAFESQYYQQLQRYHQRSSNDVNDLF
jgi:hypothetical protein